MDKELERPFMAEGEIAVGLSELHLAGRIEFKDDGEKFRLSDKGVDGGGSNRPRKYCSGACWSTLGGLAMPKISLFWYNTKPWDWAGMCHLGIFTLRDGKMLEVGLGLYFLEVGIRIEWGNGNS